jgi:hypothetical protein
MMMVEHARLVVTALHSRFPDFDFIQCFQVFTPRAMSQVVSLSGVVEFGVEKFLRLLAHYAVDMTTHDGTKHKAIVNVECIKIEFDEFRMYFFAEVQAMKRKLAPEEKIIDFADWMELKGDIISERYPELFKLMQIALLLPVTSVDPERGFSTMNILKDYVIRWHARS